jgi:hypothetical protein
MPELQKSRRTLGAVRFWLLMFAVVGWIALGAWLTISLEYPRAFGSSCHRKCLLENYWFSPALLQHGSIRAYALFVWLWLMPATVLGTFIYRRLNRASRPH